jgi:hypothetical protein
VRPAPQIALTRAWLLGHPIEPHKAMRSLGFRLVGAANVIGTSFCCECNLSSLHACPQDLDPRSVCVQNKQRLASEKRRWEDPPFNPRRPELHLENRKAPMTRLIQKLGLASFRNVGPLEPLDATRVGIPLKQRVGEACQPLVQSGQAVRNGQVLGRPPTRSGTGILAAAAAAAKAANVIVFRIHVAMALGGKGLLLLTGSVADVRAGFWPERNPSAIEGCLFPRSSFPGPAASCSRSISTRQ